MYKYFNFLSHSKLDNAHLSFQGVWHIPNREVDRPGSFAFHMSRCVTLLMQVLKETNDGRMLMQLSVQLGKIPESDKYTFKLNIFHFL